MSYHPYRRNSSYPTRPVRATAVSLNPGIVDNTLTHDIPADALVADLIRFDPPLGDDQPLYRDVLYNSVTFDGNVIDGFPASASFPRPAGFFDGWSLYNNYMVSESTLDFTISNGRNHAIVAYVFPYIGDNPPVTPIAVLENPLTKYVMLAPGTGGHDSTARITYNMSTDKLLGTIFKQDINSYSATMNSTSPNSTVARRPTVDWKWIAGFFSPGEDNTLNPINPIVMLTSCTWHTTFFDRRNTRRSLT